MPMIPFAERFPGIAVKEMLTLPIEGRVDLPDGEYCFEELYCNEKNCDCRRVIINVETRDPVEEVLATISYGWESLDYYTRWTCGPNPDSDIQGPSLDPLNRQTPRSEPLLALFREAIRNAAYVERLKRHYRLFKASPKKAVDLLTVPEILEELENNHGMFPESAVLAAVARREEIAPHLLRILEDTCARAEELVEDVDYLAHIYAMYLLAQFRDARAYPLVMRFARLPGNLPHDLTGDLITEQFCNILASVCGGNIGPIHGLIEDPFVEEYVRSAGLRALNVLVQVGTLRREEVVAYHRRLFSGSLEREVSYVWDSLVCCATELHPGAVLGDIRQAYREGLVETFSISLEEVENEAQRSVEAVMAELSRHDGGLIEDTVDEMEWWACFHPEPDDEWDDDEDLDDDDDWDFPPHEPYVHEDGGPRQSETYIRPDRKIGRNEPCPCGSGKKYKKCCGG